MALAGEREGLIPAKRCSFHNKLIHPGDGLIKTPENIHRHIRRCKVRREVGVGVDHDVGRAEASGSRDDLVCCLPHSILNILPVDRLDRAEDSKRLIEGVLRDSILFGDLRLLLSLVLDVIRVDQKKSHCYPQLNRSISVFLLYSASTTPGQTMMPRDGLLCATRILMVAGEGHLPLIQVLRIMLHVVGARSAVSAVEDQLADRHPCVDPDRPGVHVAHLKRDRPPKPRINPASGLMELNTETGDTALPLDARHNIVREFDRLQGLGKEKLSRSKNNRVGNHLLHTRADALLLVGVDHRLPRNIPDKVGTEPDIKGVRLDQPGIVGFHLDKPPPDTVLYLPVDKNHLNGQGDPVLKAREELPVTSVTFSSYYVQHMNVIRTITFKLRLPEGGSSALLNTMRAYSVAFSISAQWGFENQTWNKVENHKATYKVVRESVPDLPSSLVQGARDCACEALKAIKCDCSPD